VTRSLDPLTRLLGWRTDLKLRPFIETTNLSVERIYKISKPSLYTVLVGTKPLNNHPLLREH
jgi:hypothetical protein